MALSKDDWLSYKAQHKATCTVREMQEKTDDVVTIMINREIAKFKDEKKDKKKQPIGVG